MAESIYVGVDLHKTQFTTCIMADEELVSEGMQYPMNKEGYDSFFADIQVLSEQKATGNVQLAIESTANARFFRDLMEDYGMNVQVVNTLKFKVVNLSTKKTDKNDSKTLAEFLAKQMLPQSHLCNKLNEGLRRILKTRAILVSNATAIKNQAHAIMLAYGIQSKPSQFQSKKSRLMTLQNVIEEKEPRQLISILFDTLDKLEEETKAMERKLKEFTKDNEEIQLLQTIPGVGIVNACTIAAFTDDITRFETFKNYSAFCGLVPWVQTSNQSVYYGHITKRGPRELRTAMVQCVVAMIRMPGETKNSRLMKQYAQLKEDKGSGKAIIAIARKLSKIIYIMLSTHTPFDATKLEEKN